MLHVLYSKYDKCHTKIDLSRFKNCKCFAPKFGVKLFNLALCRIFGKPYLWIFGRYLDSVNSTFVVVNIEQVHFLMTAVICFSS